MSDVIVHRQDLPPVVCGGVTITHDYDTGDPIRRVYRPKNGDSGIYLSFDCTIHDLTYVEARRLALALLVLLEAQDG